MSSFDIIADKYFPPMTSIPHLYFLLSLIWVINQPFILFGRLAFITPDHHCRQPINASNSKWTAMEIINFSIPFKKNPHDPPQIGQPFSPCTEYAIDRVWPSITPNTNFEEALKLRSSLYSTNLSVRECTRGIKFLPSPYLRLSASQYFQTVCKDSIYISFTNSAYMIGMLVGFMMAGPLADNFGRRPVILGSNVIAYTAAMVTATSVNIWMFAVMRLLVGLFLNIGFVVGCVLLSEYVRTKERNTITFLRKMQGLFFAHPTLILLFYLTQNWRWTHFAFSYPCIPLLIGFYAWPESPRWLLSKGRMDDCVKVLTKILSRNGTVLSENETADLRIELMAIVKTPENDDKSADKERLTEASKQRNFVVEHFRRERRRLTQLIRVPVLRRNFIVVVIIFMLQAFLYYGNKFYSIRLQGNPFVIALLLDTIGVPGNIIQWLSYQFFDRKRPMTVFFGFTTVFLGVAFILLSLGYHGTPIIAMTTATSLFLDATFTMVYVRVPEMFPATLRATALGVSGSLARLGSISAVYIERLDELVWVPLPLLIFALGSLLAFFASFLMPEGKGEMIDIIDDSDDKP